MQQYNSHTPDDRDTFWLMHSNGGKLYGRVTTTSRGDYYIVRRLAKTPTICRYCRCVSKVLGRWDHHAGSSVNAAAVV